MAIAEYLQGVPRKEVAFKYRISDPTIISHWIRNFRGEKYKPFLSPKIMNHKKRELTDYEKSLEAEVRRLRYKLSQQESQVEVERQRADHAELKSKLLDTMIDIAEEQLHVSIRKKSGPKR
jgi:transposase